MESECGWSHLDTSVFGSQPKFADGSRVEADVYVSAVPVDVCKKLLPPAWAATPFFKKIAALQGVPVINLQLVSARALTCGGEGERKRGVSLG